MPGTGRRDEICKHFDSGFAKVPGTNGTGTNGTVRLGSERKFSSGSWKFFVYFRELWQLMMTSKTCLG